MFALIRCTHRQGDVDTGKRREMDGEGLQRREAQRSRAELDLSASVVPLR